MTSHGFIEDQDAVRYCEVHYGDGTMAAFEAHVSLLRIACCDAKCYRLPGREPGAYTKLPIKLCPLY